MANDFGLLIRNAGSDVLIDSGTRQLQPFFDSVISFPNRPATRPPQIAPIRRAIVNFSPRGSAPFVFYQGQTNAFITASEIFTNSSGQVTGVGVTVDSDPILLTGVTARIVLADGGGNLYRDSSNWGLTVWQDSGQEVYDSRDGVLTVIDVVDVSMPLPPSGGWSGNPPHIDVSHAFDPGAFYMLSTLNGIATRWLSFDGLIYRPGVRKLSNSSARLTWAQTMWGALSSSQPETWAGTPYSGKLLVAKLDYAV